ncbi:MAG: hypothetical protein K0B87_05245 [Candidatus Syntrophosphaera sp.]|nr:hypothetical protein [Candidatus Syntrophosphaera sp.]
MNRRLLAWRGMMQGMKRGAVILFSAKPGARLAGQIHKRTIIALPFEPVQGTGPHFSLTFKAC